MKKLISQLTLCLFMFATATSAQTAMPQSTIPAASLNSRVGVAAGVKGSVQLARDGGVGQVVSSGAEIYLGDKISTDAKGGLQILLLDQTTFTIGANSAIVVDQFVYDPATDAGKVSVRVVEGTFRFITGKIAHKNPENMQVDLPNGTIGVRGTMVMGNVNGARSLAILTGPGDKNNTGSRHGAIIVGGKGGYESKSVRIAKTGFGTEIAGDGAPKMPFLVPQALLDAFTSELSPKSGDDDSGGDKSDSSGDGSSDSSGDGQGDSEGSASEQAGQDAVDAGGDLDAAGSLGDLSSGLGDEATEASQKIADDGNKVLGQFTKVGELTRVAALGKGFFNASGFQLYSAGNVPNGSFDAHIYVNFGQGTVGGNDGSFISRINGTVTNGFGIAPTFEFLLITPMGFSNNADDFARIQFSAVPQTGYVGNKANISFNLLNVGDTVAGAASISVAMTDVDLPSDNLTGEGTAVRS